MTPTLQGRSAAASNRGSTPRWRSATAQRGRSRDPPGAALDTDIAGQRLLRDWTAEQGRVGKMRHALRKRRSPGALSGTDPAARNAARRHGVVAWQNWPWHVGDLARAPKLVAREHLASAQGSLHCRVCSSRCDQATLRYCSRGPRGRGRYWQEIDKVQ